MTDKVLVAYQNVIKAVTSYINSHENDFETNGLDAIKFTLKDLGKLYGLDTEEYAKVIQANNDISAAAEALRGDGLVFVRITGTLVQGLADLASCIYDVDASYQMVEVIGRFLSGVLVIEEFENA